jgi:hypothetical protein
VARIPKIVLLAAVLLGAGGAVRAAWSAEPEASPPPIQELLAPAEELGEDWRRRIESVVEAAAPETGPGTYTGRMASRVREQLAEAGGLARADATYEGPGPLDFCTLRLTWYRSTEAAREAFEAERQAQASMDAPVDTIAGLGAASAHPRSSGETIWLRGPAFAKVTSARELAACEALARAVDLRVAAVTGDTQPAEQSP